MKKRTTPFIFILYAVLLTAFLCGCSPAQGGDPAPEPSQTVSAATASPDTAASPAGTPSPVPSKPPAQEAEIPPEDSAGLLILSREEYAAKPHSVQPGTEFVLGSGGSDFFLPWRSQPDGFLGGNVCEGLLYMYMNDPGDVRGCIAESWERSDDGLTWTFTIRPDVLFHDGTVCDAEAIVSCWDCIADASPGGRLLEGYDLSYEASDGNTLTVTLASACPYFEQALCGHGLCVVSPSALKQYGTEDLRSACGTGPYRIESADRWDSFAADVTLKAWEQYCLPEKAPCIETVNVRCMSSKDLCDALANGDIDAAVMGLTGAAANGIPADTTLEYLESRGYKGTPVVCSGGAQNVMWFNPAAEELFSVSEVRQALSMFIDRDRLNEILFMGSGKPQSSIWPEGSPSWLEADGYGFDPERAAGLLAEAGYSPGDISFTVKSTGSGIPEALAEVLSASGIEMTVERISPESSAVLRPGEQAISFLFSNDVCTAPYYLWRLVLPRDSLYAQCRQYVYDSELYGRMTEEYETMLSCGSWEEMLDHCRGLTALVQEDFSALGTVEPPVAVFLSDSFKDGVFFSESRKNIQLYYLYV